jgi:predicted nucleic acid-binding protein
VDDTRPIAVTNTTPLIGLAAVGCTSILGDLFARLIIPFDVWGELSGKRGAPEPERILGLPNVRFAPPAASRAARPDLTSLHRGEREAIIMALETPGAWVLLDETKARRIAARVGLRVKGTLGNLVEGKRRVSFPRSAPSSPS